MSSDARRVLVNGLVCAEPSLVGAEGSGYTDEEEDVIAQHLAALGYVE